MPPISKKKKKPSLQPLSALEQEETHTVALLNPDVQEVLRKEVLQKTKVRH
jgi:hypothetical protein